MEIIQLGELLSRLAFAVTAVGVALAVLGLVLKDFRFVSASRLSLYGIFGLTVLSCASLVYGFVAGIYSVKYINHYSEQGLPIAYKIAGLWAGLDGSLLFWCMLLALFGAIVAFIHRREGEAEPERRRIEPYLYLILLVNQGFFLFTAVFLVNPFQPFPEGVSFDPTGAGLNPLLVSYWMVVHPPSLYLGYTGFTVPFAYGIASLIAGQQGTWWLRATRRWTMVSWLILTNGIILGGMWAYEVLGWGGYWAWDPVENASFMPWLTATAFLHSVMVQERRHMLKRWNLFLIVLTFFLCIFGTYLTRSGVVASVHAFANGQIGDYFLGYLIFVAAFSMALLFFRWDVLRGEHDMKSLVSREGIFFFNNLALVAIAVAVLLLTLWPAISEGLLGEQISVMAPTYNKVTLPLWIILIVLAAIGPGIGWVKSTVRYLARTFAVPFASAVGLAAVLIFFWVRQEWSPGWEPVVLAVATTFVITTSLVEFYRGMRSRMRVKKENPAEALVNLSVSNNRRYGGYIVHLGFAICVVGIITSAFFRTEKEGVVLRPGQSVQIEDYTVKYAGVTKEDKGAYEATQIEFDLEKGGKKVGEVAPEIRFYPKLAARGEKGDIREVSIHRTFWEDLYIFPASDRLGAGDDEVVLTLFVNPLINWIWAGWIVMLGGGVFAILPMGTRRVGLSD